MKEHERKEFERLEELRKTIEKSPLTQQIIAEEAAAILAKRTEAAGKIKALKKEQNEVIPKLSSALAGAETKFKKAKAALEAASDEFKTAKVAELSKNQSFDSAISRQAQILIETADPALDEAITFFNKKLDYLRSPGRIDRIAGGAEKNLVTWKKTVTAETNRDAVLSAMAYCQSAGKELEAMKLSPALDVEKIEKMKAGVPAIDVYTESTGEKPLPRVNTNPFAGMKSESHLNYELEKLNEKFKKVMKQ